MIEKIVQTAKHAVNANVLAQSAVRRSAGLTDFEHCHPSHP